MYYTKILEQSIREAACRPQCGVLGVRTGEAEATLHNKLTSPKPDPPVRTRYLPSPRQPPATGY